MSDNLKIWNLLAVTDPAYTKPFKRKGGFSGTDISPTYRQKVMTEAFGVCGHGWGWEIQDRWKDDGCVYVQVNVWTLTADGQKGWTGPQIGGTEIGRLNDESYKMATTDAFGKCVAALGVAADVYSGQFDDSKYQRQAGIVHAERQWDMSLAGIEAMLKESGADIKAVRKKVQESKPPTHVLANLKDLFERAENGDL